MTAGDILQTLALLVAAGVGLLALALVFIMLSGGSR